MSYFRNLARAGRTLARAIAGSPATGFEGSSSGRRLAAWSELDSAINTILSAEGDQMRRRCRALVRKQHWARCAEDSFVANAIGTGIKPQSLHPDKDVRKLIHSEWARWTEQSDADGLTDFYGLQALNMREQFQAGEVLARFRPRRSEDGLRVPMQIQLIEAEHLPLTKNESNGGNPIRAGIEFTPFGKRTAYYLYREHPGLGAMSFFNGPNQPVRIPAFDPSGAPSVIHNFLPLRAGQYRGQPWLAPVMVTLYELDQFVDAVLVRQKLANMFLGWQRRMNADDPGVFQPSATLDGTASEEGVGFGRVEPGTLLDLPTPGDTLEFNNPPSPGAQFGEFLKVMLHAFASGIGLPYELLTWDLEGVTYSSIRAGLLEFRRRCEQFQFGVMVHQFCRPTWIRWINDAVLAGVLPEPRSQADWDDLRAVKWRTPKWAWVDPLKDILAAKEAVRCAFDSRSGVIHEQGEDPEDVDVEIAADNQRADELGIVSDADPRKTAASGTAQQFVNAEQGGQSAASSSR